MRLVAAAVATIALLTLPNTSAAQARPTLPASLDSVRATLDKYQDPYAALSDGYLSTVSCMDFVTAGKVGETPYPVGAMGVHVLNGAAIGAPLDPSEPQVLIYEPRGDTLRLVGAEWFVPVQVSAERPQLRPSVRRPDGRACTDHAHRAAALGPARLAVARQPGRRVRAHQPGRALPGRRQHAPDVG